VGVLIDVDTGLHRCGVPPGEPAACVAQLAIQKGLRYRGLMGYEGQLVRKLPGPDKEQAVAESVRDLVHTAAMLEEKGIHTEILSGGGTGTYSITGRLPGMTEIQAGSYLLMDTDYQKCCADFDLSLTVLTSVLSKALGERIVVDAGLKSLSCERGIPTVKDMPGLSIRRLTAEHGIIDLKEPAAPVEVGDKIEIWVHYSDATVNLHDRIYGIRDGQVEEIIRVEG
jgi:D-serine deaminase-like pyridoxal phosphate-dependent protein